MPLQIVRTDITKMKVDAIVNTTNEEMVGYSGVDGAIHKAAGPALDAYCRILAPLELGFAKVSPSFNLGCKYIIHTSGPIWQGGYHGEKALLKSCYVESLRIAKKMKCESVAFPLISSGTYGYPKDQVMKFAVEVITEFLEENEMTVFLCIHDRDSYEFSKELFRQISMVISKPIALTPFEEKIVQSKHTSAVDISLDEYLKRMDKSFSEMLFYYIDHRGMKDVECYKKANISRKIFSKIKCDPNYRPSKQTAVAFAIALELDMEETQQFLASAGMTLARNNVFDKIIRYFIQNKKYNIFEINEALFEFDQVLLGC